MTGVTGENAQYGRYSFEIFDSAFPGSVHFFVKAYDEVALDISPKHARKLAKALKRAARKAENR